MASNFVGITVFAGFVNCLTWLQRFIQMSCPVGHEQFIAFYISLQLSMRILMNTYLIATTCYHLVIATSVGQPLCITVTLHRLQGEIFNYLLKVHFTDLSTRDALGNVCQANCRDEYSSSQTGMCFGSRSVSSLRQGGGTDALVPLQMAGSIFISSCMFNHPPVVHTSKSQLESMSGKDDLILLSYSKAQVH